MFHEIPPQKRGISVRQRGTETFFWRRRGGRSARLIRRRLRFFRCRRCGRFPFFGSGLLPKMSPRQHVFRVHVVHKVGTQHAPLHEDRRPVEPYFCIILVVFEQIFLQHLSDRFRGLLPPLTMPQDLLGTEAVAGGGGPSGTARNAGQPQSSSRQHRSRFFQRCGPEVSPSRRRTAGGGQDRRSAFLRGSLRIFFGRGGPGEEGR
mmetsp:Transcript_33929/g.78342  ORF Transcript_33929/g.78342 Transcript_33929/m.78342 type:complete len:205 (+) Transcript_33929:186-800(+)